MVVLTMGGAVAFSALPKSAAASGEPHEVKLESVGSGSLSFANAEGKTTDEEGIAADFAADEQVLIDVDAEDGTYPTGFKIWIENDAEAEGEGDEAGDTYLEYEGAVEDGRVSFKMPDDDVHARVEFSSETVDLDSTEVLDDVSDPKAEIAGVLGLEDRDPSVIERISMLFGGDPDLSTVTRTNRFIQLVRTYVVPGDYADDVTFDDFLLGATHGLTDNVITSMRSTASLYSSGVEGDEYLYAYVGDELSEAGDKPFLWQFARATDDGVEMTAEDGFTFDPETCIVKIPRAMVEGDDYASTLGFSFQTIQELDMQGGTRTSTCEVNLVSERFGVPVKTDRLTITAPMFDNTVTIPVVDAQYAHDLTAEDFVVHYGDDPFESTASGAFDQTTGELALPLAVSQRPTMTITLKAADPITSVIDFLLSPAKAFADVNRYWSSDGSNPGHRSVAQMLAVPAESTTITTVSDEELADAIEKGTMFSYCAQIAVVEEGTDQPTLNYDAKEFAPYLYADSVGAYSHWLALEIWGQHADDPSQWSHRNLQEMMENHGQNMGWGFVDDELYTGPWSLEADSERPFMPLTGLTGSMQSAFCLPGSSNATRDHSPQSGIQPTEYMGVSLVNDVRDVDGEPHIFIEGVDWSSLGQLDSTPQGLGACCSHITKSKWTVTENTVGDDDGRLANADSNKPGDPGYWPGFHLEKDDDSSVDWASYNDAFNDNGIINFRVLYYDDQSVVLGFILKATWGQSGCAVYKFQRDVPQGTVVHFKKVAEDSYIGSVINVDNMGVPVSPEYSLAGAKIKIYVDNDQTISDAKYGTPDYNKAIVTELGEIGSANEAMVFMTDEDGEITLDGDGNGITPHLYCAEDLPNRYKASMQGFNGYYVIEEIETPDGFNFPKDENGNTVCPRLRVTLSNDDQGGFEEFQWADDPVRVVLHAYKADTTMLNADGSVATHEVDGIVYPDSQNVRMIQGAKFTLIHNDGAGNVRTYYGESNELGMINFYMDEDGDGQVDVVPGTDIPINEEIPLGHIDIYETTAPDGYLPVSEAGDPVASFDIKADDVRQFLAENKDAIDLGAIVFDKQGNWNLFDDPHLNWDSQAPLTSGFDPDDLNIRENVIGWDLSLDKYYEEADGQWDESEVEKPLENVAFAIYRRLSDGEITEDNSNGELVGYVVTGPDGYVTTDDSRNAVHPGTGKYRLFDRTGTEFPKDDNRYTYIWFGDGHRWDSDAQAGNGNWRENIHGAIPYAEFGYYVVECDEDDIPQSMKDAGVRAAPIELQLPGAIVIDPDQQVDHTTLHYNVSNVPVVRLGIQKRDAVTGKTVPMSDFTFELWKDVDEDGKLNTDVDTIVTHDEDGAELVDDQTQWTTNSKGHVVISLPMAQGKYLIREVATPNRPSYLKGSDADCVSFDFVIGDRPEETYEITVDYADEAAYGHVKGVKVDSVDTSMKLEGAQFKVRADEPIVAGDSDHTLLVPEGTFVKDENGADLLFTSRADGTFSCHDEGDEPERGCLPIDAADGTSQYSLVEVRGADGHVNIGQPKEGIPFTVSYVDDATPDVWADVGDVPNVPTEIRVRKTADKKDVTEPDKLLGGATFAMWDKADETGRMDADEIDPDGRAQVNVVLQPDGNAPVGLRHHVGGSAVVQSTIDPRGYVALDPVIPGGNSYTIKGGTYGNVEPGIYDVTIYGVALDNTTAGTGDGAVDTAEGVTFVAGNVYSCGLDAENAAEIRPTGVDSLPVIGLNPVPGHSSTYYCYADPDIYDVLVSGEVAVDDKPLKVGTTDVTYFVGEGKMPEGSWCEGLLSAQTPIETAVTNSDPKSEDFGVATFWRLGHWDHDTTYKLTEAEAPKGYITDHKSYPVTFDSENRPENQTNGVLTITRIDMPTPTYLSKKDMTTSAEVPGATLRVLDRMGNVIDEWVSTNEPHYIEALEPGTYYLEETIPPRTHEQANRVMFEVADDGSTNQVTMYDEEIEIDALIDKRQEIVNPTDQDTEANGDNANQADTQADEEGRYDYSLDYKNNSNTWVDEFTVQDDLDMATEGYANLTGITTAQGFEDWDGKMNVWYKTNMDDLAIETGEALPPTEEANATKDGHEVDNPWLTNSEINGEVLELLGEDLRAIDYTGWHLWAADVPTDVATELSVDSLPLKNGEFVTSFRFEYGRVEKDFTTRLDRWDDPSIKDSHDDVNDVTDFNTGTFATDERPEVPYAPAKIHMQANDLYLPDTRIDNSARVDAYRNGGNLDKLEGHDTDAVTQVPKGGDLIITGQLDKRQEIADPTAENVVENGDGKNRAEVTVSEDGTYQYSLDFRNTSPTWVDEFTVTDSLDAVVAGMATLDEVTTPMAAEDYDGYMNVWYQTDKSVSEPVDSDADQTVDDGHVNAGCVRQLPYDGWRLWKDSVPCDDPVTLKVSELPLAEGEKVTGVRFEFGRVEEGFTSRKSEETWTREDLKDVHDDLDDILPQNSKKLAPAILQMKVTKDYVQGKPLDNSAVLDLYRTVGGTVLSAHDADAVTQTPKTTVVPPTSNIPPTPGPGPAPTYPSVPAELLSTGFPALLTMLLGSGGVAGGVYLFREFFDKRKNDRAA